MWKITETSKNGWADRIDVYYDIKQKVLEEQLKIEK